MSELKKLKIEIHSFSYKKGGIPKDNSINGGGFVFDCRGILNPGRIEKYKTQTGNDIDCQTYLEENTKMPKFLSLIHPLISISIENYLERDFDNLIISFGCTGGQHRSVYSAIKTAEFVRKNFPEAKVLLIHDEQKQLNV